MKRDEKLFNNYISKITGDNVHLKIMNPSTIKKIYVRC